MLIAVPLFSIARRGLAGYLRTYIRPTPLMLPFNIISEASRTLALAIRLYGNVMSGTVIVGILISVAPFFFPVLLQLLGLLTGLVQAYIFAILAMVYIASASQSRKDADGGAKHRNSKGRLTMDPATWIAIASIVTAGLTIAIGSIGPALAEGRAAAQALQALAQQPDASDTITRTLFVSLAMIESTAIYCFVVSMILIFANPFTDLVTQTGGG